MAKPQLASDNVVDRSDHVWYFNADGKYFKCILCGAVDMNPPNYPTPKNWMPGSFEDLKQEERELRPFKM